MLKPVLAATAALAIAGSSIVYAQQRDHRDHGGYGDGGRHEHRQHHQRSVEDVQAFADARIAALKAGLELTPDQAKSWPAFEQALRDMVQLRIQRMQARQARMQQGQNPPPDQNPSPFDRMGHRADNLAKMGAALKKVADAGAPLYQSLTDTQKGRFTTLARMLRPHHHRMAENDRGGGWRQDGGYGGDGDHHRRGFGHQGRWGDRGNGLRTDESDNTEL